MARLTQAEKLKQQEERKKFIDGIQPINLGGSKEDLRRLETKVADSEARMDVKVKEVESKIETKVADSEARMDDKVKEVESKIETKVADSEARMDVKVKEVESKIETKVADSEARMDDKVKEVESKIETKVADSEARMDVKVKEVESKIETKVAAAKDDVENYINDEIEDLVITIKEAVNKIISTKDSIKPSPEEKLCEIVTEQSEFIDAMNDGGNVKDSCQLADGAKYIYQGTVDDNGATTYNPHISANNEFKCENFLGVDSYGEVVNFKMSVIEISGVNECVVSE